MSEVPLYRSSKALEPQARHPFLRSLLKEFVFLFTSHQPSLFFSSALRPRVELCTKIMRLKYEPASEPLHISVK